MKLIFFSKVSFLLIVVIGTTLLIYFLAYLIMLLVGWLRTRFLHRSDLSINKLKTEIPNILTKHVVNIFVCTTDTSGDLHASYLIRNLQRIKPNLHFRFEGIGGSNLQNAGVEVLVNPILESAIGFIKPLRDLGYWTSILRTAKEMLTLGEYEGGLFVQSSLLNLRLFEVIDKEKIKHPPLVWYLPSQRLWAYQSWFERFKSFESELQSIRCLKGIISPFDFEAQEYKRIFSFAKDCVVSYEGHPFLDIVKPIFKTEKESRRNLTIPDDTKVIGLMPGSRSSEIKVMLPIMLAIADMIMRKYKESNLLFFLPVPDANLRPCVDKILEKHKSSLPLKIISEKRYDAMRCSTFLIAASGSVTLEALCLETPCIILYTFGKLEWFINKKIINLKTPFLGLPNIIAKEKICPEFLQNIRQSEIAEIALNWLQDESLLMDIRHKLRSIKEQRLGKSGVLERIAKKTCEMWELSV